MTVVPVRHLPLTPDTLAPDTFMLRQRHILCIAFAWTLMLTSWFYGVVVKILIDDAFVVTAYLTDRVKKGTLLWPKKS